MLNEQPPEHPRRHPLDAPPPRPKGENAPQRRIIFPMRARDAYVTYILLAVNIGIFIIRALSVEISSSLFEFGANNHDLVFKAGEYHRLFTSMFLHAGIHNPFGGYYLQNALHILFNAYIIYQAGTSLERVFGHARFAIIYLLGGVFGSILSALLNEPAVFSVGASGAAFALIAAELVFVYRHRELLGELGRRQIQSLVSLIVINIIFGVVANFGDGVRVDNWGHIGGAIGGAVLAFLIMPVYVLRQHPEQANALFADDVRPFRPRVWMVAAYCAVLIAVLLIGSQISV